LALTALRVVPKQVMGMHSNGNGGMPVLL